MCGFAAVFEISQMRPSSSMLERMSRSMKHRGPSSSRMFVTEGSGFAFRRLSIIDLTSAADQPMFSEDNNFVIVFNGEIYNYIELRDELIQLGHRFKTQSDTEVLLHAYQQWDKHCLSRLNGAWAFLIYNFKNKTLFGSRDRFGKKPLFYYRKGQQVLFSSEIKGILSSGVYTGDTNWASASRFLMRSRMDDNLETFFSGIDQIPAAHAFELDASGELSIWQYWSILDPMYRLNGAVCEACYDLLCDSVKLRLRSDVPIGVSLSGGLDSTAIISIMRKLSGNERDDIHAFCYMANEYDESVYINQTISQTGAHLHKVNVTPESLWKSLFSSIYYNDAPLHGLPPVISFELYRLAADLGIKVVLSGQGADELFAGYSSCFGDYWYTLLEQGKISSAWREIQAFSQEHRGSPLHRFASVLLTLLKCELGKGELYQRAARFRRIQAEARHSLFNADFIQTYLPDIAEPKQLPLRDMMLYSVERSFLPLYLREEDRNSMANSVETRLPFLDYRLGALAFQLPDNYRLKGPWNKYIVRKAVQKDIPPSVYSRLDKMGFPAPLGKHIAGPWAKNFKEILFRPETASRGIYNMKAVENAFQRHCKGEADFAFQLFNIVQFEIWNDIKKTQY